jgi:hypothetical protein
MRQLADFQASYQDKPTEELLDIWRKNDRSIYRDEVFEAIRQILIDRKCDLPSQDQLSIAVAQSEKASSVVITGIDVPFWDLVFFMVKWTVASVPAMIIIGLIGAAVWMLARGIVSIF